jgi:hypothetical protein
MQILRVLRNNRGKGDGLRLCGLFLLYLLSYIPFGPNIIITVSPLHYSPNLFKYFLVTIILLSSLPLLMMINIYWGTCRAYKTSSPLPTKFSSYAWARNWTLNHMSKEFLTFITWTNSFLVKKHMRVHKQDLLNK